jgi:hypothetical protein
VPHPLRIALPAFLLLAPSAQAWAADTVEAFEPGVSDFEAGVSSDGRVSAVAAAVGVGLTPLLSVSASLERGLVSQQPTTLGMGTFLGLHDRWVGLDLFGELGWDQVQGAPTGWLAGLELDDPRHMVMPYLRAAVAGSLTGPAEAGMLELGVTTSEPLRGVHPHLEAALKVDWQGHAGTELALGPNLSLGEGVELIPELRAGWGPDQEGTSWTGTVGVIVTRAPESWSARIARREAEREALALAD